MGLLKIFSRKSPADYERTGDDMACQKEWGEAKLAFEAALNKMANQSLDDSTMVERLREKLHHSKEALAAAHRQEAMALMDADCMADAHELLNLALDLTDDPQLKEALTQEIRQASRKDRPTFQDPNDVFHHQPDEPAADVLVDDDDDYFNVLLGALPDEVQQAYRSYGDHFKQGYLALNGGGFDQAVTHLSQALEDNTSPLSLIPLELATAYVNLGQAAAAKDLLEELVKNQPDLLPAFELLCEIYWEDQAFDQALLILDDLAPELAQSMGAFLLKGETLFKAARYEEAKAFFQNLLETYGWQESIAMGLAKSLEALGQTSDARDVYGEIISKCSGCGTRIDASIKRKYADLSFASGDYSGKLLECYLALSQEDSANAMAYFQNISRIYAAQGNDSESRRFQSIAEGMARSQRE